MTKCKVTCIISLFFLEKKSEIWNAFTLFENWKVNLVFLSLISRMKSEMKIPWDRDREWKVKWKCLEIEIEKWNVDKILENSRETRLSQVTVKVCHLSQNFSTQITSREYFSVFWTDLHPNGPSWGLIEHLECQSLKERYFRDTLYFLLIKQVGYR